MNLRIRERSKVLWALTATRARLWASRVRAALEPKLIPPIAFAWVASVALLERARTGWRRIRGVRPRLIWGPTAIINIRYWSGAMERRGYVSRTCVDAPSVISTREDFDVSRDEFLGSGSRAELFRSYAMFAWTLRHGDVFLRYFDGGFMRGTPLDWWECRLLRLAGKKLIASPFGGDVAVPGYLGEAEDLLFADYPELPDRAEMTKRRVLHTLRWADASIRNYQAGFQPSYDVVWPTQLGIDTDQWVPEREPSDADGENAEVVVVHAPNHRAIKGTSHLERAVSELRADGLRIDLQILERRPNEEVRAALQGCDLVADQFMDPGYALFSIEAMASGKPVMCRMSPIAEELQTESLRTCPIVDTRPENLSENLKRLVRDPSLRRELGRAGREFAVGYHSYEAVGRDWEAVIQHVWRSEPLPQRLAPTQPAPSS
jgi:hypothetical protein